MKIDLTDRYSITTDEYNYILQRKRVNGNKRDNLGYFPNLSALIQYLLNHEILIAQANELMNMKKVMETIRDEIVTYLGQFNIHLEARLNND